MNCREREVREEVRKMTKSNKKVLKYLVGIGAVSCFGLFLFNYFDKEDVLRAHPTQEITIDKENIPDISMEIPKDATNLIEPALDETLYKDYVQGGDISRTSTKNLFSTYSSRSNFQASRLQSANSILALPNGNFITLVYDADSSIGYGRQALYYVKNTGEILATYDVITNSSNSRFEDFTNLGVTESNDKYYFSLIARNGGNAELLNMELNPKLEKNQFNIVNKIPSTIPNMGAIFTTIPSVDDTNKVALNTDQRIDGKTMQSSEFVTYKPFISNDMTNNKLENVNKEVTVFNPASENLKNLNAQSGYTGSANGSVTINAVYQIDSNNYLVFERAYLYNLQIKDYVEVNSISLYDSNFTFKKNLYISDIATGSSGNVERFTYFEDLTKDGQAYVYIYSPINASKLVKIDTTNTGEMQVVKSYPKTTSLLITKSGGSIRYVGNTNGDLEELVKFGVTFPSIISGDMNEDFSIKNVSSLEIPAGTYNIVKFIPLVTSDGSEQYGVYGMTTAGMNEFDQNLPLNGVETTRSKIFFGSYFREADYAPLLKKMPSMIFDLTAYNLDKSTKDEKLLEGIAAYDTVDSNTDLLGQTWIQDRVNRNVNTYDSETRKYTQPIDWSSLGFEDNGEVGPNRVTYFATDSNLSKTSTSRIVNKVDHKTEYDEDTAKAALRAENFTIKLTDLQALQKSGGLTQELLTGEKTSTYGNVLAWDLDKGDTYNTEVKVDPDQLAAINAAKAFGKFPLKYTLTKNNKTITKNTYVYVMGANSQQVGENGTTIFNTDPIELPWDITSTLTTADLGTKVMTDGKVVAYDFETGEDITKTTVNGVATVSPIETDLTALKALKPKNTTDKPKQTVHYAIKRGTTEESATTTVGTEVTVYYRFATVTIKFKDEDGNTLYDKNNQALTYKKDDKEITIAQITLTNQIVGKTINFTTLDDITEPKTAAGNGTGYDFVDYFKADNTTKVTTPTAVPVQWKEASATTDPNEYTLKYKGLLRFLSIPETMTFDSKVIRAFDQESSASKDNSPLTVGDNRKTTGKGEVKGKWKVNVTLVDDFKLQEEGSTEKLLNILYYGNTLITKTEGTTIKTNSTATTKTDIPLNNTSSFKLKIPAGQAKKGTYQATIKWDLLNAP